jgi:hypothetical protein
MPELPLNNRQRDPFVGHLDRMSMPELVRKPTPHPILGAEVFGESVVFRPCQVDSPAFKGRRVGDRRHRRLELGLLDGASDVT